MAVRDIVVTWPKVKPLRDYLAALAHAQVLGSQINYRVARPPSIKLHDPERGRPTRCYRVYNGEVRGFTEILSACWRDDGEVTSVGSQEQFWPAGWYIVCSPVWHQVVPCPMKGFQDWRYYDYIEHMAGASG